MPAVHLPHVTLYGQRPAAASSASASSSSTSEASIDRPIHHLMPGLPLHGPDAGQPQTTRPAATAASELGLINACCRPEAYMTAKPWGVVRPSRGSASLAENVLGMMRSISSSSAGGRSVTQLPTTARTCVGTHVGMERP